MTDGTWRAGHGGAQIFTPPVNNIPKGVPYMKIKRTVDWFMGNNSVTQMFMETTEDSQGGMFNGGGGASGSYIQVPLAGLYLFQLQIGYIPNGASGGAREAIITGAIEIARGILPSAPVSGLDAIVLATGVYRCAANQSIAPFGYQSAGGATQVDHLYTWFSGIMLST